MGSLAGIWRWLKAHWPHRRVKVVSLLEAPKAFDTRTRFVVERVAPDGVCYHGYAGMDGSKAVEAWEEYVHDLSKRGKFTFHDRQHPAGHRGTFVRP